MAEVVIVEDAAAAGALVGAAISDLLLRRPDAVLGVATGSTPLPVYEDLRRRLAGRDLSRVRAFALDEYVGIDRKHPESYHSIVSAQVTRPLGLDPRSVHIPNGQADDLERAAHDYEGLITAVGGIDLQLLGIGTDGHIGFNEPGSSFASRTRIKTLTPQTRQDNARFFDSIDDVPSHALTQGLGTILEARHLVLLAFGDAKADAVARAIEGPLSPRVPATAIHLHPHTTVVLDSEAAARLQDRDFYRYVYEHKPTWQTI